MRYSFLVNLVQKIIEIGQYLQKLLQKVYGRVFFMPHCVVLWDITLCCLCSWGWQLQWWVCECIVHQLLATVASSDARDWVQDHGASQRTL